MEIEQLVNQFRKRFAIPNLIICIGILFFLGKLVFVWFGPEKEIEVKLPKIDRAKDKKFVLHRKKISLPEFEIIPKKNLFRPSRTEWVPPPPPPKPAPPPPPEKKVPPPEITISGILGGGKFSRRAILQGSYYSPVDLKKNGIKKKGYKLFDMIGQYRINKIDSDTVTLMDPNGNAYEFYLNKHKAKRKEILNKESTLKGKNLLGESVTKWKPAVEPGDTIN